MQRRIIPGLNAALGCVLLLSVAAVLPAASWNTQLVVPLAQALKNAPQKYTFVSIDPPGGYCTDVTGMTDLRLATVVYSHDAECQTTDTALWLGGQFYPLLNDPYPANPNVSLADINNWATVFGNYGDSNTQHAAELQVATGRLTTLPDITGMPYNWGQRISDTGIGVGWACDTAWPTNCVSWKWNGKSYTFLNFDSGLPLFYQFPAGINIQGQILWFVSDQSWYQHAYVQQGTKTTCLDVPGALATLAWDINNLGEVALNAAFTDSMQHYLWKNGALTAIPDVPASWGSLSSLISGVNDLGDYYGQWADANWAWHGFIALRK